MDSNKILEWIESIVSIDTDSGGETINGQSIGEGGISSNRDSVEHEEILLSSNSGSDSSVEISWEESDRQPIVPYEISTESAEDDDDDDDDVEIIKIKTCCENQGVGNETNDEVEPNNAKSVNIVNGSSKESNEETEITSDKSSNGYSNVPIEDFNGEANAVSKERSSENLDAFGKEDVSASSYEEYEKEGMDEEDLEESSDKDRKGKTSDHLTETKIDLELPKMCVNKMGEEVHFFRLPNFLNVETRPFDPQTYEAEAEEEENLDEEGVIKSKLRAENTIRWRKVTDDNGREIRESNSRIVKWSDGSYSFHLGSEVFDIHHQDIIHNDNHLFILSGTGLEGQAVFRSMFTFRPHSVSTYTRLKMPVTSAVRRQKLQKIRVLPNVGKNPETDRLKMLKQEEQKLKASTCRERKQWKMKRRYETRLNSSSLESEACEDDGAISISAIKNQYKAAIQAHNSNNSSEEASGSNRERVVEGSGSGVGVDDDDDDSDLDYFQFKKMTAERKRKIPTIEESDED